MKLFTLWSTACLIPLSVSVQAAVPQPKIRDVLLNLPVEEFTVPIHLDENFHELRITDDGKKAFIVTRVKMNYDLADEPRYYSLFEVKLNSLHSRRTTDFPYQYGFSYNVDGDCAYKTYAYEKPATTVTEYCHGQSKQVWNSGLMPVGETVFGTSKDGRLRWERREDKVGSQEYKATRIYNKKTGREIAVVDFGAQDVQFSPGSKWALAESVGLYGETRSAVVEIATGKVRYNIFQNYTKTIGGNYNSWTFLTEDQIIARSGYCGESGPCNVEHYEIYDLNSGVKVSTKTYNTHEVGATGDGADYVLTRPDGNFLNLEFPATGKTLKIEAPSGADMKNYYAPSEVVSSNYRFILFYFDGDQPGYWALDRKNNQWISIEKIIEQKFSGESTIIARVIPNKDEVVALTSKARLVKIQFKK